MYNRKRMFASPLIWHASSSSVFEVKAINHLGIIIPHIFALFERLFPFVISSLHPFVSLPFYLPLVKLNCFPSILFLSNIHFNRTLFTRPFHSFDLTPWCFFHPLYAFYTILLGNLARVNSQTLWAFRTGRPSPPPLPAVTHSRLCVHFTVATRPPTKRNSILRYSKRQQLF